MQPNLPPRPAPEPAKKLGLAEAKVRRGQHPEREAARSGGAYTPKPSFGGGDSAQGLVKRRRRWFMAILAAAVLGATVVVIASRDKIGLPMAQEQKVLVFTDADLDREATALARGEIPPLLANFPEQTRAAIASGEQSLYTARILDSQDEDGDAVKVAVNEVSIGEIELTNGGAVLTVPLRKGVPQTITYLATRDGGGGVTFGVLSSAGEFRTRVMAVGASERWRVSFR